MSEARSRATIEALVTAINARDLRALDNVFTEDVVMEWPQSGERIRGKDNIVAINENYPGLPKATLRRALAGERLVVTEVDLDYGGKLYHAISIFAYYGTTIAAGDTWYAQVWYRDSAHQGVCDAAHATNLTNGYMVTFTP